MVKKMPGFIKPQLATLKSKAPAGEQWIQEIKYDGYRVQIHLNRGRKNVYTRNGLDWTKRFSAIAGSLNIPGDAIIDGEVVVVREGRTNFSELQAELAAGRQDRLEYYAFDLLWRDGQDLRKTAQLDRKRLLRELFDAHDIEAPVHFSEHLVGNGQEMFEHASKLRFERHYLKASECAVSLGTNRGLAEDQSRSERQIPRGRLHQRPVQGWRRSISANGKDLVYMGKVGTGWNRTTSAQIRRQLDTVISPKSKLTKPVRKPKATWVEPKFIADIEYRDITSEGLLRASSFKGLLKK